MHTDADFSSGGGQSGRGAKLAALLAIPLAILAGACWKTARRTRRHARR
jgi:hypothetical protein